MPTRVVVIETDTPAETEVLGRVVERFFAARRARPETTALPSALPAPFPEPAIAEDHILLPRPKSKQAGPKAKKAAPAAALASTPHKCPECGERFTLLSGLNRHRNQKHDGAAKAEKRQAMEKKAHACDQCEYRASTDFALNVHRARMHGTVAPIKARCAIPRVSRLSRAPLDSSSAGRATGEDDD